MGRICRVHMRSLGVGRPAVNARACGVALVRVASACVGIVVSLWSEVGSSAQSPKDFPAFYFQIGQAYDPAVAPGPGQCDPGVVPGNSNTPDRFAAGVVDDCSAAVSEYQTYVQKVLENNQANLDLLSGVSIQIFKWYGDFAPLESNTNLVGKIAPGTFLPLKEAGSDFSELLGLSFENAELLRLQGEQLALKFKSCLNALSVHGTGFQKARP